MRLFAVCMWPMILMHRVLHLKECCILQVLDDSTDRVTRDLVDDKVLEWRERGVDCEVLRRTNRAGYKAGALKEVRRGGNAVAPIIQGAASRFQQATLQRCCCS